MENCKITQYEIDTNNVKSAPTHNADADPQANKHLFDKLPELIAAKFNALIDAIIAMFLKYYTKTEVDGLFSGLVYRKDETYTKSEVDTAIDAKVVEVSGADMLKSVYDTNKNGVVDNAENGIFEYTHTAGTLTGSGTNGRFKAAVTETVSSLAINGTACAVKCGEDSEIELVEGCWYTFILDGDTVNFKQGGAGINFKIVGSTTQPASPKENTIWINTSTAIGEWQFSATEPTARADGTALAEGNVWLQTKTISNVHFNVFKKNRCEVYLYDSYQYIGGAWVQKDVKIYYSGEWHDTTTYILHNGIQYYTLNTHNQENCSISISNGVVFYWRALNYKTCAACYTATKIDLTNYSTVKINISGLNSATVMIAIVSSIPAPGDIYSSNVSMVSTQNAGYLELDIANIVGEYYVYVWFGNNSSNTANADATVSGIMLK